MKLLLIAIISLIEISDVYLCCAEKIDNHSVSCTRDFNITFYDFFHFTDLSSSLIILLSC